MSLPKDRKRKAEDELKKRDEKVSKADPGRDKHKPTTLLTKLAKNPNPGTQPTTSSANASLATPGSGKNGTSTTHSDASRKPPKKGTFAEIMARGQQAQVGKIAHKPIESLGGKKALLKQQKTVLKGGKPDKLKLPEKASDAKTDKREAPGKQRPGPSGPKGKNKVAYQGTARPKQTSSYQGTMKPNPSSGYCGTMKPSSKPSASTRCELDRTGTKADKPRNRPPREYFSDDELESDRSEGRYDYASEDFSDMDAGFDDVEEEEEVATKAAKKEDKYEQMMLEEMKRQKEARKKRLMTAAERENSRR